MDDKLRDKIDLLRQQGVEVPAPETLEIGDEVDLRQITGPQTVLHGGTKLYGRDLMILPGARIGYEEPCTVEDCAVGPDVRLNGGYYAKAVFLDRVVMGKGAHVRVGTLMEEESNGAHTVGLKQTVLLPFVTLGSLINFCDVLMAGGSSRRDHSEVGSSYIHFNFTPFGHSGDKATPSLVGDVPRGVMLRAGRIFLGGQGGLVGPVKIDYGTVLAAGFVYRRDHGPDQLVVGEKLPTATLPFTPLRYSRIRDKVSKNLSYIGNLIALWHWYSEVRSRLAADQAHKELYARAQAAITLGITERIKRLGQIAGYMEDSIRELTAAGSVRKAEIEAQRRFAEDWPTLEQRLSQVEMLGREGDPDLEVLTQGLQGSQGDYIEAIKGLPDEVVDAGTRWLTAIVSNVEGLQDA
jgi:bifunctional UDP-N-acetylglucosamine pyrophosphorylase / glucosamine-1-phosphate N-acetyltransferase